MSDTRSKRRRRSLIVPCRDNRSVRKAAQIAFLLLFLSAQQVILPSAYSTQCTGQSGGVLKSPGLLKNWVSTSKGIFDLLLSLSKYPVITYGAFSSSSGETKCQVMKLNTFGTLRVTLVCRRYDFGAPNFLIASYSLNQSVVVAVLSHRSGMALSCKDSRE